jgi:large subunit ribosomal protein L28
MAPQNRGRARPCRTGHAGIRGSGSRTGHPVGYSSTLAWAMPGRYFFPRSHKGAFGVASVCDICGKGPGFGNWVSFSHRRTPRRFNPNIQTVRAKVDGTPRRLNVCTSCIKAGKVTR